MGDCVTLHVGRIGWDVHRHTDPTGDEENTQRIERIDNTCHTDRREGRIVPSLLAIRIIAASDRDGDRECCIRRSNRTQKEHNHIRGYVTIKYIVPSRMLHLCHLIVSHPVLTPSLSLS